MNDHKDARMILASAAEANDEFVWDRVKALQTELFAAGPAQIKFAYFGREGALQTRVTNADDWPMDRGRAGCVCGCYVQTGDIPGNATRAYSGSRYPWGPFSRPP